MPINQLAGVCWTTTCTCNMRCPICYAYKGIGCHEISTKDKFRIIDKLINDFSIKKISFGGGEPLLTHDIFKLIRYAKSCGVKTALHSNGKLLDANSLDLLNNHLDEISLPLDGANPSDHLEHRGEHDHFFHVLNVLDSLSKTNILTDVSTVITSKNYSSAIDILDILKETHTPKWKVFRFYPLGRGLRNKRLFEIEEETFSSVCQSIITKNKDYDVSIDFRNSNPEVMRSYLNITPDGRMSMIIGEKYKTLNRLLQESDPYKKLALEGFNYLAHESRHWRDR